MLVPHCGAPKAWVISQLVKVVPVGSATIGTLFIWKCTQVGEGGSLLNC